MAEKSVLAKLKELDAQRERLLIDAKNEALAAARAAIGNLGKLGFPYRLVEGAAPISRSRRTQQETHAVKDAPCPICDFKTSPPHDGRAHRSQGNKKKPFTVPELSARGMTKAV